VRFGITTGNEFPEENATSKETSQRSFSLITLLGKTIY